jgi:hypothetical protein
VPAIHQGTAERYLKGMSRHRWHFPRELKGMAVEPTHYLCLSPTGKYRDTHFSVKIRTVFDPLALFFWAWGLAALLRQKPSRSPPSGCSAPTLPRRTGGNPLSSTAVVCAPAGGPSEGPRVPSQLESLFFLIARGFRHREKHLATQKAPWGLPGPCCHSLTSGPGRDDHAAAA